MSSSATKADIDGIDSPRESKMIQHQQGPSARALSGVAVRGATRSPNRNNRVNAESLSPFKRRLSSGLKVNNNGGRNSNLTGAHEAY